MKSLAGNQTLALGPLLKATSALTTELQPPGNHKPSESSIKAALVLPRVYCNKLLVLLNASLQKLLATQYVLSELHLGSTGKFSLRLDCTFPLKVCPTLIEASCLGCDGSILYDLSRMYKECEGWWLFTVVQSTLRMNECKVWIIVVRYNHLYVYLLSTWHHWLHMMRSPRPSTPYIHTYCRWWRASEWGNLPTSS